jgi:phosphatidylserine/phosphatidylglycerophosphate/cardiolipin synthase-like enzyme
MPLLTPDNYEQEVLKLIKSAKEQVLFQNQSLSLLVDDKNDARFEALAEALQEKQEKGLDVRIIMRGEFDVSRPLEQLQERGFDMDRVRLQDRCHTKGIIVDGVRVLIGSHNWTNQGTLVNRDASLIFHDREIAEYYRDVFEFDWKNLTRQSVDESREVVLADESREAPAEMVRLSWEEILLD